MGKIKKQKCFEFLLIMAFEQTKEHISRQVQPLKMLNNYKIFFRETQIFRGLAPSQKATFQSEIL